MAMRRGAKVDAPTLHLCAADLANVDQARLAQVLTNFGLAPRREGELAFPSTGAILEACGVGAGSYTSAIDTEAMNNWLWLKEVLILHAERSVHGEWAITREYLVFERDEDGDLVCDGEGIHRRVRIKSRTPPPKIPDHIDQCIRAVGLARLMEDLRNADEHWARDEFLENYKRIRETQQSILAPGNALQLPGGGL
jgi:hypothetical protein